MVRSFIFDLDDTLVDSIGIHIKANNAIFSQYIKEDLPVELKQNFVGMRVIEIIEEIIDYYGLKLDPKKVYRERNEKFLELVKNELELMPGAVRALEFAKKNELPTALATSGNNRYVDLVLEKFKLKKYFDIVITGDDVRKGKPSPETYLTAVEKLGLNPAVCLVFEDATNGIKSAKDAGCKCVAIKNNHTPKQDLSRADFIIDSLEDFSQEMVF